MGRDEGFKIGRFRPYRMLAPPRLWWPTMSRWTFVVVIRSPMRTSRVRGELGCRNLNRTALPPTSLGHAGRR